MVPIALDPDWLPRREALERDTTWRSRPMGETDIELCNSQYVLARLMESIARHDPEYLHGYLT
jgi:hypothetical protein